LEEEPTTPSDQQPIEATSFIIIDFETVTPKGFPPEPIELGARRLTAGLCIDPSFVVSAFINPPVHAPLTPFDIQQTGIQESDLRHKPSASFVLAACNARLPEGGHVLVAHNARYEAAILQRYEVFCPRLAAMPFLDTVALGKYLVKGLPNYQLNTLARHFALPIPSQRHRALPDVELTAKVLLRLLELRREAHLVTLADLLRVAGLKRHTPSQVQPVQLGLFER